MEKRGTWRKRPCVKTEENENKDMVLGVFLDLGFLGVFFVLFFFIELQKLLMYFGLYRSSITTSMPSS